MGNNQNNITEKLTRLNIILFGEIPKEVYDKELNKYFKDFKILDIGNKSYKIITSRNPLHAHNDFILLDKGSITDIKLLVQNLKKVVLVYFDNKNENFNKEIIRAFHKVDIENHPFIIFSDMSKISKRNREFLKEYYKKYIYDSNINFDPLNIYFIGYEELHLILERIENYYNEEQNKIPSNINLGINLCVLGKPGKGKSSFINCIAEEKIALEGPDSNVTTKFNKYKILKEINQNEYALLNIYDCPGFTLDGKAVENIKSEIKEKFTFFKKEHDYIHGFLYFSYNEHNRTLEEKEIEIIDFIYKLLNDFNQNPIILFIINHIEDENSQNSYKNQLLKTLKENFGNKFENENNIIYINVKKKIIGIDKVFKRLYDYFTPNKVQILPRDYMNYDIEQKKLINKSIFFKYIKKEEDMISRYKNWCNKIIELYSLKVRNEANDLNKNRIIELRKEMLMNINKTINSSSYIRDLELHEDEDYEKMHWYGKYIKKIPYLGKYLEGEFMSEQSQRITNEIGSEFINILISNMRNTSTNAFCLRASKIYNNSIELLKKISELFEDKDLIELNTEIINNEFIIKFITPFKNPKIKSSVEAVGDFYIFIIIIKKENNEDEKTITHKETITPGFILEKLIRDRSEKNNINEKCEVSIYFKLKNIEYAED